MSKYKRDIDKNILNAIVKLQWPLLNNEGKIVYVRVNARNENGFEHIAGKNHYLKVRDIEQIPQILKKPYKIINENKGRKGKSYFGIRKGDNKSKYLKIIVRKRKDGNEEIITVYPNKEVK